MDAIRGRIACVLTECGFTEAAHACVDRAADPAGSHDLRKEVEAIVRQVMQSR